MKRPQYQLGTLYQEPRKSGPDVWGYRWRETDEQGQRVLRRFFESSIFLYLHFKKLTKREQ